jgi:hypothetical protein
MKLSINKDEKEVPLHETENEDLKRPNYLKSNRKRGGRAPHNKGRPSLKEEHTQ